MITGDELFALLPAVYRVRDAERGGALRALVEVLAGQAAVVERDIQRLYDNWFVETCDPWVLAYIGDLLAVRGLHPVGPATASPRAYVANTLAYRRRKGTTALLEQLAFDVTGWRAKAVEYFQLLGTTQHVNHVRPVNHRTPDLRDADGLDLLSTPFERATRTAEVRRIEPGRGRYNIPNVGLALWRLGSYPLGAVTARRLGTVAEGRYTFSPLGLDTPLFNPPATEETIADLAREVDVPGALRRRALFDELEALRQATVDGTTAPGPWLGDPQPVLRVWAQAGSGDPFTPVPPERVLVADLGLWQRPPATKAYRPSTGPQPAVLPTLPIRVAVDPERGRLTFPTARPPFAVLTSHAYGFSGDVGGGPYDRTGFADRAFLARVGWQRGVTRDAASVGGDVVGTLAAAVQAWNAQPAGAVGVIAVLDNRSYDENLTGPARIELKEGSELLIVAADWPVTEVAGIPVRLPGRIVPEGRRPHVRGDVSVIGTAPAASATPGRLRLDGLLVDGRLTVLVGNPGGLQLVDSTLLPTAGGLSTRPSVVPGQGNGGLVVSLERSISGPVSLAATVPELGLSDTIVDSAGAVDAVTAPGSTVDVSRSTVLGGLSARQLDAGNSILHGAVAIERLQTGCVRFCYVSPEPPARTPRRYRCQPDLALDLLADPVAQGRERARMVPSFTTLAYGQPAYAQLGRQCPVEIRTGAESGTEMGVFGPLSQPQREANLRAAMDEYLRFGLEAGAVIVT